MEECWDGDHDHDDHGNGDGASESMAVNVLIGIGTCLVVSRWPLPIEMLLQWVEFELLGHCRFSCGLE